MKDNNNNNNNTNQVHNQTEKSNFPFIKKKSNK